MRRHVLLRLYPRAWRERYGEELSAQLEAERPLRIGVVADLVRGALDAHLHPLHRENSTMRVPSLSDRRTIAARAMMVWSPVAAVAIVAVIMLIDFWYGHLIWFRIVDAFGDGAYVFGDHRYVTMFWYRSDGWSSVRFFPYEELYDLALHLAMLAVALAGALLFAAVARKALRQSERSAGANSR